MTRQRDSLGILIAAAATLLVLVLMAIGDPAAPSVNQIKCVNHDACMGTP